MNEINYKSYKCILSCISKISYRNKIQTNLTKIKNCLSVSIFNADESLEFLPDTPNYIAFDSDHVLHVGEMNYEQI